MDLRMFKKLAVVSVIALGAVMYADNARSATILSGTATSVPITATVQNTITVNTTPLLFGTIAARATAANNAVATLTPTGTTLSGDNGPGFADGRILPDPANAPTPASVTIVAFNNTLIHIDYSGVTNMSNGGNLFNIVHLRDNLNAPDAGVGGVAGNWGLGAEGDPGPVTNQGTATTTGAGALDFHIGGSFSTTDAGILVYPNGTYSGDFDVTVSY